MCIPAYQVQLTAQHSLAPTMDLKTKRVVQIATKLLPDLVDLVLEYFFSFLWILTPYSVSYTWNFNGTDLSSVSWEQQERPGYFCSVPLMACLGTHIYAYCSVIRSLHVTNIAYSTTSSEWVQLKFPWKQRYSAMVGSKSSLYFFREKSPVLVYDIATETWQERVAVNPASCSETTPWIIGDKIYLVGGETNNISGRMVVRYDMSRDEFLCCRNLHKARASSTVVFNQQTNSFFVIGGWGDERLSPHSAMTISPLNSYENYSLESGSSWELPYLSEIEWSQITDYSHLSLTVRAVFASDLIYLFGFDEMITFQIIGTKLGFVVKQRLPWATRRTTVCNVLT